MHERKNFVAPRPLETMIHRGPMADDTDDPWLEAFLDEVLAPHRSLPPHILAEMRHTLRLLAQTHPDAKMVINRARPRPAPLESGEQPIAGSAAHDSASHPLPVPGKVAK
jgi:hypothetical protein